MSLGSILYALPCTFISLSYSCSQCRRGLEINEVTKLYFSEDHSENRELRTQLIKLNNYLNDVKTNFTKIEKNFQIERTDLINKTQTTEDEVRRLTNENKKLSKKLNSLAKGIIGWLE